MSTHHLPQPRGGSTLHVCTRLRTGWSHDRDASKWGHRRSLSSWKEEEQKLRRCVTLPLSVEVCVSSLLPVSMLLWLLWLLPLLGGALAVGGGDRLSDCLQDNDYDRLLRVVQTGLPPVNRSHHVVIVGAGLAGLTTAKLLQDAGHQVDVAEGRGEKAELVGLREFPFPKAPVTFSPCVSVATR